MKMNKLLCSLACNLRTQFLKKKSKLQKNTYNSIFMKMIDKWHPILSRDMWLIYKQKQDNDKSTMIFPLFVISTSPSTLPVSHFHSLPKSWHMCSHGNALFGSPFEKGLTIQLLRNVVSCLQWLGHSRSTSALDLKYS